MIILVFYALNVALLLSCFLHYGKNFQTNALGIALVQSLISLPLLATEYTYFAFHLSSRTGELIFFSEASFIVIWLNFARKIQLVSNKASSPISKDVLIEIVAGISFILIAGYIVETQLLFIFSDIGIILPKYGAVYFLSILTLLLVLFSSWKIEEFWRSLGKYERWKYRLLIAGCFLICGTLAWSTSFRLTYMVIYKNHLLLLATLLLFGWAFMAYDFITHNLLTKKIYISRKAAYSTVFPTLLAVYFIIFGTISFAMKFLGFEMFFVIKWLIVVTGIFGVLLFSLSEKLRRRANFFISSNFYANKYEYRNEWLKLSENLEGAQSEKQIVQALNTVLYESLYTKEIYIWLGDSENKKDFSLISGHVANSNTVNTTVPFSDSLVHYLKNNPYFFLDANESSSSWQQVKNENSNILNILRLKLITPISINNHISGLIGIGAEYTGKEYSYDDFDLLSAIGSQTAAALLSVRMSEKVAEAREQEAWHRLSAFVLHDIKNAATMLALVQENAPNHIHEPEFQNDVLELIDDTLRRMKRVEDRLNALRDDQRPNIQSIKLAPLLQSCTQKMSKRLPNMQFYSKAENNATINSDPKLLQSILENLLLNAAQAQNNIGDAFINAQTNHNKVTIEVRDNGPGIAENLLPDALFEPFKTTKKGGTGIGLWQVKQLITTLGGAITVDNMPNGGAKFTLQLPFNQPHFEEYSTNNSAP